MADPALAASLLGADADTLLRGSSPGLTVPREGALFESLVTLSVRVYAHASDASSWHLRTQGGDREVDLIVERGDRKVVALEIKLAATPTDADVSHLRWLQDRLGDDRLGDDLLDAAILTTGTRAYRRKDGIAVIPAVLLGP